MCCTASDYSGGQAFDPKFFDSTFYLNPGVFPFIKEGLAIGWECSSQVGGHTASEWVFARCKFYSIRLAGTQTFNFIFDSIHMLGFPCGPIQIDAALTHFLHMVVAKAETLFSLGWDTVLDVDGLFVDKPGHCLVDYNSFQPRKVSIDNGDTAGWHFISRSPCTVEKQRLLLREWTKYRPNLGVEQSLVYHCSYDRMKLDMSNSDLLSPYVSIVQPTLNEFVDRVPSGVPVTP
jgi:hypothetical protein